MSDLYYKNQLAKIKTNDEFPAQIVLSHEGTKTNYLSLNQESAQALADFLLERFKVSAISDTCEKCGCTEFLCGHNK